MLPGFAHKQGMLYVVAKEIRRKSRVKNLVIQVDL
jgi:hypothetical protein